MFGVPLASGRREPRGRRDPPAGLERRAVRAPRADRAGDPRRPHREPAQARARREQRCRGPARRPPRGELPPVQQRRVGRPTGRSASRSAARTRPTSTAATRPPRSSPRTSTRRGRRSVPTCSTKPTRTASWAAAAGADTGYAEASRRRGAPGHRPVPVLTPDELVAAARGAGPVRLRAVPPADGRHPARARIDQPSPPRARGDPEAARMRRTDRWASAECSSRPPRLARPASRRSAYPSRSRGLAPRSELLEIADRDVRVLGSRDRPPHASGRRASLVDRPRRGRGPGRRPPHDDRVGDRAGGQRGCRMVQLTTDKQRTAPAPRRSARAGEGLKLGKFRRWLMPLRPSPSSSRKQFTSTP